MLATYVQTAIVSTSDSLCHQVASSPVCMVASSSIAKVSYDSRYTLPLRPSNTLRPIANALSL